MTPLEAAARKLLAAAERMRCRDQWLAGLGCPDNEPIDLTVYAGAVRQLNAALRECGPVIRAAGTDEDGETGK
jgi:hypothetical protein